MGPFSDFVVGLSVSVVETIGFELDSFSDSEASDDELESSSPRKNFGFDVEPVDGACAISVTVVVTSGLVSNDLIF